jgi:hypothetical protein
MYAREFAKALPLQEDEGAPVASMFCPILGETDRRRTDPEVVGQGGDSHPC